MPEQENPLPSNPDPILPAAAAPDSSGAAPPRRPASYWLKRLLACNPFFLVSAALLLFGMYKVSMDANFLRTEVSQLAFNLTSLQIYELLLVVTAIVLVRRRIWYDATLLFVLENMLAFVSFILISQAALIKLQLVWWLCPAAALLTSARFGALQRRGDAFAIPSSFILCGGAVLAANTALPIVFRILEETKVPSHPAGAAYVVSDMTWLLLLPALFALMLLLPRAAGRGKLFVQRRWFPLGLFLLWLAGTVVHVYCLDYVYDFELRRALITPAVWVLAWVICRQLLTLQMKQAVSNVLWVLPLAATLLSAEAEDSWIFFALNAANVLIFAAIALTHRENRFVRQLILVSATVAFAALPREWVHGLGFDFGRADLVAGAILGGLMLCVALSRDARFAVFGAIAAAIAAAFIFKKSPGAVHWAAQAGFVFFLLHSLRWNDREHAGANAVRAVVAFAWVVQALVWCRLGNAFWNPIITATIVLVVCAAAWLLNGKRPPVVVLVGSLAVASSSALNFVAAKSQTLSVGLLAVIGSFLLFAAGTILAMTKYRWHKTDA